MRIPKGSEKGLSSSKEANWTYHLGNWKSTGGPGLVSIVNCRG